MPVKAHRQHAAKIRNRPNEQPPDTYIRERKLEFLKLVPSISNGSIEEIRHDNDNQNPERSQSKSFFIDSLGHADRLWLST